LPFENTSPITTSAHLTTPHPLDYNPKSHAPGYIPGRVHPVVAELRDMKQRFVGSWRGFLIVICFVLRISFITEILRAAWRFIQH
jgi:hypothetical protein